MSIVAIERQGTELEENSCSLSGEWVSMQVSDVIHMKIARACDTILRLLLRSMARRGYVWQSDQNATLSNALPKMMEINIRLP